ncbi:hypothetical protein TPADAL_0669a [Treponema pallidum subsp. pallidum DAL-1]|uniref:Uncharacterized protein n=2 Tax=Treponema pallidum TaxID=160 RepID=A0AAU8SAF3_TREPL|nr:hypothetical protein TPESAMD_0669a [Treponema pallidum subsp. pertenue str. SamoaD]AEZ58863.1 hypothetical protein TPECDC2_0669a [Treponema pallidum subsp. pertenue str. CDC2]AEZ59931.1 hypothetical protein TPEGAU_0669a [Treponema pallidum subsp. pertenue str. Gauthier]AEZ60991.1 hypothetical protein TPADAL_0669a [Treponema pallidum subsp. pallidum DAL-1]AGK84315.1 hypothetical protein TPFB_0669a [Treponema pallidum str. Fribourg-Blanc]AJB40691.1 hypothetical protein TENDBA_0669a [Treponema
MRAIITKNGAPDKQSELQHSILGLLTRYIFLSTLAGFLLAAYHGIIAHPDRATAF